MNRNFKILSCILIITLLGNSVFAETKSYKKYKAEQQTLINYLNKKDLTNETKFSVIKKICENMNKQKEYNQLIIFLTDWVENNPDDFYNAYWLLMTAYAYLETNAEPIAQYYFERIINNYNDLLIQGKSIHLICLEHLIQITANPVNRISYFNQLTSRFPDKVNTTEIYYRLSQEYEKTGEWDQVLKATELFLEQDDASTIQIAEYPNAYTNAKNLVELNKSPKDWAYESLDDLVDTIKKAISTYDYKTLDQCRSKANFFAMSWRQDETDSNAQESFSMHDFMLGNKIRYSQELDESSSATEAYLRTSGWNQYVTVWYLYFRKINFPADPNIHGQWEWAGIYFGEKL